MQFKLWSYQRAYYFLYLGVFYSGCEPFLVSVHRRTIMKVILKLCFVRWCSELRFYGYSIIVLGCTQPQFFLVALPTNCPGHFLQYAMACDKVWDLSERCTRSTLPYNHMRFVGGGYGVSWRFLAVLVYEVFPNPLLNGILNIGLQYSLLHSCKQLVFAFFCICFHVCCVLTLEAVTYV